MDSSSVNVAYDPIHHDEACQRPDFKRASVDLLQSSNRFIERFAEMLFWLWQMFASGELSGSDYGQAFQSREGVMKMLPFPYEVTEWAEVPVTEHKGESGIARWRTRQFGEIRVRIVEYSPGYVADHWCSKGHVVLCLEGEFETELHDGRRSLLKAGMSYQVADNAEAHRSSTKTGAKLFIVD